MSAQIHDDPVTRDAQWLLEQPLKVMPWIVESLLPVGLILLVGAPKTGKSWFALQLAICLSLGLPFLGFATIQADVLYLCLEDTFARIQQRLFKLTDEANGALHFAISAGKLQSNLLEQLEKFLTIYPTTKLIILDTFQTVRGCSNDNAYASDYTDLGMLKRFADEHGITLLVVHHTRKMGSADIFDTVSGTTGITGSADQTMVLARVNRCDGSATLSVTGRDVEYAEYKLRFNSCRWEMVEKVSREELEERDVPPAVLTVLDFMSMRTMGWCGTATELITAANIEDIKPNVLAKFLNEHRQFLHDRGIEYTRQTTPTARLMYFDRLEVNPGEANA